MDLKIIRLAMRRMLITSKLPKPLVPKMKLKPKRRLWSSHRRPK